MKTHRMGLVLLVLSSAGCGSTTHDDLIKEQIRCIEEAAQVLESIKDSATAGAARPKLKKLIADIEEQNRRGRALEPLSADELRRLGERAHERSKAALDRLNQAVRRAAACPGCEDVVGEFRHELGRLLH
jgi:DNA invertase Pin-like site-specific DNA recombinase